MFLKIEGVVARNLITNHDWVKRISDERIETK